MNFSLRIIIPSVLAIFTLILAVWSLFTNGEIALRNVETHMKGKLKHTMNTLQEDVELGIKKNNIGGIKRRFFSLASDDNLKHLSLLDEEGRMVAESSFEVAIKGLEDVLPSDPAQRKDILENIERAKSTFSGSITLSHDKNTLWAVYPIRFGPEAGGIRLNRVGIMIAEVDLHDPKAVALALVKNQVIQFCWVLGVLVIGLGLFIYFAVTQRIQKLVLAIQSFGKGESIEPVFVGGIDEISILAESFSEMVTARMQIEKDLKDSEERFSTIFKKSPMGVALVNSLTGKFIEVNEEYTNITGLNRDELTAADWMSITHPDDLPKNLIKMEQLNDDKIKIFKLEKRYVKPGGAHVWVNSTVSKFAFFEKGVPVYLFMVENVQERKEAEARIEQAQKQLLISQKLASIGELSAGVSHEVLNPLNIISLQTQMLQRKSTDDANLQSFCDKVIHEVKRIQKITGSLLEFSRSSSPEFKNGCIQFAVDETLDLVEEGYKLENIKIVRNWCDENVEVVHDPDKIRQVFLNLLQNAKHAMPHGGTITVGCEIINKPGKRFQKITFGDTGKGMSEEVRQKIFEPFFTTKAQGDGTGLGLSVVHGIIQEHGGKIRVESQEGKGTTFVMTFLIS